MDNANGEKCDDGNSESCGTCNATCSNATPQYALATGQINNADPSSIPEGATFTISDGINSATFEFTTDTNIAPGHVAVNIGGNNVNVAEAIDNAIDALSNKDLLNINSKKNTTNNPDYLKLENKFPGTFGNRKITQANNNTPLTITGMSGGLGRNCPLGVGCTSPDDCDLGLSCTNNVCSPTP